MVMVIDYYPKAFLSRAIITDRYFIKRQIVFCSSLKLGGFLDEHYMLYKIAPAYTLCSSVFGKKSFITKLSGTSYVFWEGDSSMKKCILISAVFLVLASSVFAGDVATLVNLGFSQDSAYFMFGFYGLDVVNSKPYAELYIVNTRKNEFVPEGVFRGMYASELKPGWDPAGGFYRLFSDAVPQARKYGIDHLAQGRLVYLLINGENPADTLSFKDYDTSVQWDVALRKTIEEKPGTISSSFGLELSFTKNGKKTSIKAGNPSIKRKNVADYIIKEIFVAPDEKTVVAIIERKEKLGDGQSIRYMVETFTLP